MATSAAPAGGARNGAGPEWGGFEENIQVMAPRLRLPAAPGPSAALKCPSEPGSLVHLQHFLSSFESSCTRKAVGLVLVLKLQTGTPARGLRYLGPIAFAFHKFRKVSRRQAWREWAWGWMGFTSQNHIWCP